MAFCILFVTIVKADQEFGNGSQDLTTQTESEKLGIRKGPSGPTCKRKEKRACKTLQALEKAGKLCNGDGDCVSASFGGQGSGDGGGQGQGIGDGQGQGNVPSICIPSHSKILSQICE